MAQAFCDSPSYRWILMDLHRREDRFEAHKFVLERNLAIIHDRHPEACRCVRLQDESNKMIAAFMWTPREHEEIDLLTIVRYGLLGLFRFGWRPVSNLVRVIDRMGQLQNELNRKGHYGDPHVGAHDSVARVSRSWHWEEGSRRHVAHRTTTSPARYSRRTKCTVL